jgi:6-pyruvoyltetrahydropterin/6-carboxytetrahydropterin synthase
MSPLANRLALTVCHEIQVAHRLFLLPGKCQNIHGHSMKVTMEVYCQIDNNGYAMMPDGTLIEFGQLKKEFRRYLDEVWDHHLHLNRDDPWAKPLTPRALYEDGMPRFEPLPGLRSWPGDPSTENIARWIKNVMEEQLSMGVTIVIQETSTNGVIV